MVLPRWAAVSAIACLLSLGAGMACAQSAQSGLYQPAYPTLSPWLNLYQRNTGPLDPYHMYVRPEMQLRDTLRRQDTRIQQQGVGIGRLKGQVSELEKGGPLRPTGTGSVFMDYSHYYDLEGGPAGHSHPRSARTSSGGAPY